MAAVRKRVPTTTRAALARMLRATGLGSMPDEAPLVDLLKRLAKKLDEGGGTRDEAMYLSALKDARKVLDRAPAREKPVPARRAVVAASPVVPEPDVTSEPPADDLQAFKQKRGIA